jgi:SAM-dependent methyltransferase
MPELTPRGQREIFHSRKLAAGNPEEVWGWSTPAGKVRVRARAARIARRAGLRPGVRALEIGCGTGIVTELFVPFGANLLAVDISEDMLAIARQRGLPPDQVQFMQTQFESIDENLEQFDAVIGSGILHHLHLEPALAKIYKLLKPGGVGSFAEPNMLNPQTMLWKNIPWLKAQIGDSPDETALISWQLRKKLRAAGFIDIEIIPLDFLHPITPVPLIGFVSRLGAALEKLPILRHIAGSLYITFKRPPADH